jgi:adenosylmethionine-8-amino-7-oxononanoate aminotransferase
MSELSKRDKKIIWHPFTQEKTAAPVLPIVSGKGSYLYDENGKEYLDLISSWWVNLHGHANEEIASSICSQAKKLEHVIFAGFTHSPAVELCEELGQILPNLLAKFFFSDNGSTAVEVALKMAYQYWHNQGIKRKYFLSFEGGYHGDTFGAMSVGSKSGFHDVFADMFFQVLNIPYPNTWDDDASVLDKEELALAKLDRHLAQHGDDIAAIILEPLIQGASGMRVCRPSFVRSVIEKVKARNILVIFDEVMTGFGRTGTNFALEQIGVVPDFLCLSKGITGGFLPLALTITTQEIYNAFLDNNWRHAFAHGHSYTANPLACAAAVASLKLLRQDKTLNAIREISLVQRASIDFIKANCSNTSCHRTCGTIAAFDLKQEDQRLKLAFLEAGLLLRPLGRALYLLPPYSTTAAQLEEAYDKIRRII